MPAIYGWFGGRKWMALYVVLALFTTLALLLEAAFSEYTYAVGGVLAWVTAVGMREDNVRHKADAQVRTAVAGGNPRTDVHVDRVDANSIVVED